MSLYRQGKEFVTLFYSLIKATAVYDLKNDVVVNAADKMIEYLKGIFQAGAQVEILRYRDYIFFNKTRLRFEIEGYASLQFIEEIFKKLGIKSITMSQGVNAHEITQFSSILKGNKDTFGKDYILGKFSSITVEFSSGPDELPDFLRDGEQVRRTYFKALKVTKNLLQNLWVNQPVDTKGFRRVVYTLIDSLSQDEFGLTSLTVIKNFDEYTYNHSLNVGVLALALGQRLNLEKKSLVKLGTAGLLHDIGKVAIEKDVIYKPTKLSDREWDLLKMHCHFGVGQIIKTRGLDDIALSAIISAYQHHLNYDGTGYPEIDRNDQQPVLFARIIRICDAYDAMTTSRPYQIVPYLPSTAVRVLWKHRGRYFDPLLVKIFVQLTGLYPAGSCLELSSGEIGLVIRQNPGSMDLPIIKIIVNKNAEKTDGTIIDLMIARELTIVRPVYPEKYSINPASYFVS